MPSHKDGKTSFGRKKRKFLKDKVTQSRKTQDHESLVFLHSDENEKSKVGQIAGGTGQPSPASVPKCTDSAVIGKASEGPARPNGRIWQGE